MDDSFGLGGEMRASWGHGVNALAIPREGVEQRSKGGQTKAHAALTQKASARYLKVVQVGIH